MRRRTQGVPTRFLHLGSKFILTRHDQRSKRERQQEALHDVVLAANPETAAANPDPGRGLSRPQLAKLLVVRIIPIDAGGAYNGVDPASRPSLKIRSALWRRHLGEKDYGVKWCGVQKCISWKKLGHEKVEMQNVVK